VLRLVDSDLANGQVNLFVLALVLAALEAWLARREERAGVLLGCASALKIVPAFFVLLFPWRAGWRALLATIGSSLVCVLLLPVPVIGWRANVAGLASWYREELVPFARGGNELLEEREYVPGQSLTATLYRLLCDAPSTSAGKDGPRANLVALDPDRVQLVVRAVSAALLAVVLASLLVSVRRDVRGARLREAALVACAALALAPLVHKAHMVWLLLAYAVLLSDEPSGPGRARLLRRILVAASVLAIGGTTPALLGRAHATGALAHNAVSYGLLLVASALLVDVWSARERPERGLACGPPPGV
jgi:hypothetical protein